MATVTSTAPPTPCGWSRRASATARARPRKPRVSSGRRFGGGQRMIGAAGMGPDPIARVSVIKLNLLAHPRPPHAFPAAAEASAVLPAGPQPLQLQLRGLEIQLPRRSSPWSCARRCPCQATLELRAQSTRSGPFAVRTLRSEDRACANPRVCHCIGNFRCCGCRCSGGARIGRCDCRCNGALFPLAALQDLATSAADRNRQQIGWPCR